MIKTKILFLLKDSDNYFLQLISKFNGYETLVIYSDLEKNIYEFKPDFIYLTYDNLVDGVLIAKEYKIPTILYLDTLEVLCPSPLEMLRCDKVCLLCDFYNSQFALQEDRKYFFQYTDYSYTHLKNISDISMEFINKDVNLIDDKNNIFNELDNFIKSFDGKKSNQNKLKVIWEGSQFINHSFAVVNREVELELLKIPEIDLSIYPYEKHSFNAGDDKELSILADSFYKKIDEPDFTIKNKWPPNFGSPLGGEKLVIVQPWEMGSMPQNWIKNMSKFADQVWVASNANRDAYIKDGLVPDKVKLIPWGVRKELFEKEYDTFELGTNASFKFLFNGGCVHRKGIDLLLEAYSKEFTRDDDVCLIIKDVSSNYVYDNVYKSTILELMSNEKYPQIIYIAKDLTKEDLISLYKSCNCYVHPYRGEGFGLPIVEAMASGLPVIVTNSGSALDFCKEDFAYLLDFKIKTLDEKSIYTIETVRYPSFPEAIIESLRYYLRYAYTNKEESKMKGIKAKEFILNNFTWKDSAEKIYKLLSETKNEPVFRNNKEYYFNDYLKKGLSYYQSQNYEYAYSYFFEANIIDETDTQVIYYKGICEYYLGDYKSSIQNISIAYKQAWKDKEGYKIIIACFEKLGDEKTATILKEKYQF